MKTNAASAQSSITTTREAYAAPATPLAAAHMPSVHVRALITWLAIFPLVAGGMAVIAPFSEGWHPVLRAFALTLVVVPLAVYFVVPRLFKGYGVLRRGRTSK
ncbi:hypothetical protein [Arthrobacter sp. R4-81]